VCVCVYLCDGFLSAHSDAHTHTHTHTHICSLISPNNQSAFSSAVYAQVEQAFQSDRTVFPIAPEHDPVATSLDIYQRYVGAL
jgi:hypothetical protein